MAWSWAALMPHPPIIVPEVGYGREKVAAATLQGTAAICAKIEEINRRAAPEVLLLLSPHESYTPGMLFINTAADMRGSLARFGAPAYILQSPLRKRAWDISPQNSARRVSLLAPEPKKILPLTTRRWYPCIFLPRPFLRGSSRP